MRTTPAWILRAVRSSNLLVAPDSRLGSQVYESSTTTAQGLFPGLHSSSSSHNAIGGVAVLILHPQESPPPQLSGCVELWLPPTPRPGYPVFVLYLNAACVRYEDDGTGPPSPPESSLKPRSFVLFKWVYASCWWIPAGGKVRLCCCLCGVSRLGVSRYVLRSLEWRRSERLYIFSGPAG